MMKNSIGLLVVAAVLLFASSLSSCSSCSTGSHGSTSGVDSAALDSMIVNRAVESFSDDKPLALRIRRERSFFQAEKISKRLLRMGVDSYIVRDSTAEDGVWYVVAYGAFSSVDSLEASRVRLDTVFHLVADAVDVSSFDSLSRVPVRSVRKSEEVRRIDANAPNVPSVVSDVVKKYPQSDNFQIKSLAVLSLDGEGVGYAQNLSIDMPRGVSLSKLRKEGCRSLASAVLRDNLYDDIVSLQVVRAPERMEVNPASVVPLPDCSPSCLVMRNLASEIADLILASGNYDSPIKETYAVRCFYSLLTGYHVAFAEKGGVRSYYILADEAGDYLYIAQCGRADDREVVELVASIGSSDVGLAGYDEFYNTFYLLADEGCDGDRFVGYGIEKLGRSYARSKGNAAWARRMVGCWTANFFFVNESKGAWAFSVFDLVSSGRQRVIYNDLYMSRFGASDRRTIYGLDGVAVRGFFGILSEVNFGVKRYVVALNGDVGYTERDLIMRAEALQFECGGYGRGNDETASGPDGGNLEAQI